MHSSCSALIHSNFKALRETDQREVES